jgi:hypothetical protein
MRSYFSTFHAIGEVADMLLLREPKLKLLVDISLDPPGHEETAFRKYPNRTSYSISDRRLIDRFLSEAAIGKVVEMHGRYTQSAYIPHKTSYIDTVFTIDSFTIIKFKTHDSGPNTWDARHGTPRQLH